MLNTIRKRVLQPGANLGLSIIFDGLVVMTRLARGKQGDRTEVEMRAFNGAINYEFIGGGGATWHLLARDGRTFFHRGAHPDPMAKVNMSVDTFFKLLTGHAAFMVALMTGQVAVHGDGHAGMAVGAMIGSLQHARQRTDGRGRFTRHWTNLALRASGTGHRFKKEPSR